MPRDTEWFDRRLHPEPNTGCLLWSGSITHGYGVVRYAAQYWRAHRLSWTMQYGPIPDGLGVLHKCDTPLCCNVAHLFLGTQRDNNADRHRKGRDNNTLKTHCIRGHRLAEPNLVPNRDGWRVCRVCKGLHNRGLL